MTQSRYEQLAQNPQTASYLTQATLRDILLPSILGAENDAISYWAGKQLALQFPLDSFEDLCAFFEQINFGHLSLKKQKKEQYFFELTGPIVASRIADFDTPDFQLEAGFVAQILEQQLRIVTEAKATIENKKTVTIFVQTDSKAPIEDEAVEAIHLTVDAPQVASVPSESESVEEEPAPVMTQPVEAAPEEVAAPTLEPESVPETPVVPEPVEPEKKPTSEETPHYTRTRVADLPSRREMHRKRR
ncbi:YslB family protein [Latilactobacillus curvatus]|uniref:YslB family protein n=1 Tax=Latilactobacillus curvatus TaxID=28038 RepID=UPI001F502017|nr:YslB family protein [Latilactobacillus curvatus]